MPTFTKLKSGSWRVQVRRKNEYVANTFIRRRDAEEWAIDVGRSIDRGAPIRRSRPHEQPRIFSDLIALHLDDLAQVGKPVRRSVVRLNRHRGVCSSCYGTASTLRTRVRAGGSTHHGRHPCEGQQKVLSRMWSLRLRSDDRDCFPIQPPTRSPS
jgi:hypothetical protein